MQPRISTTASLAVAFLLPLAAVLGCGGGGDGNRVTGTVTFKGAPVPAGKIYFMPDGAKNNTGPTGYADIKDGAFDTSAPGGRGTVAGPMVVAVEGIDPNPPPGAAEDVTATVLFPRYETTVDLPEGNSEQNIEVPAEAADYQPAPEGGATHVGP